MRNLLKPVVFSLVAVLGVFLFLSSPALTQPRPMAEDVFTPIAKGYDFMRDGKFDAAEYEFKTALQKDRYNPFALNNLAALEERRGKLKDAMAYLTDAGTYAKDYLNKFEQICFPGGLCTAVKPVKEVGQASMIAPVIQENMAKLKDKIAKTPAPPVPSKPPEMDVKKPDKEKGK